MGGGALSFHGHQGSTNRASGREFKVVVGYLAGIDVLPGRARALGLVRRCTLVLDSYRAGAVDVFFDAELYAALLRATCAALGADAAHAETWSGARADVTRPEAVIDVLARLPAHERAPFPAVTFVRAGQTAGLALYEPYVAVGGPEPYHDAYAVPLYTHDECSDAVVAAALRAGEELGARGVVLRGDASPRRAVSDWIRALLAWVAGKR